MRTILIIVKGAVAVRLAELSSGAADEAEIVIVPAANRRCRPILAHDNGATQLFALEVSNAMAPVAATSTDGTLAAFGGNACIPLALA